MRHLDQDMDLSLSVNCSCILFFWVVFIVFECFLFQGCIHSFVHAFFPADLFFPWCIVETCLKRHRYSIKVGSLFFSRSQSILSERCCWNPSSFPRREYTSNRLFTKLGKGWLDFTLPLLRSLWIHLVCQWGTPQRIIRC